MTSGTKTLLVIALVAAALIGRQIWLENYRLQVQAQASMPEFLHIRRTGHYLISSNATEKQTSLVADSVETFHAAYMAYFSDMIKLEDSRKLLQLVLYKNRLQFKQYNKSQGWAEAYYRTPNCYAYYADTETNPYHWMIHEATHQMNQEVGRFKKHKWIDEGLASYFGSSKIHEQTLVPGSIDANAYPAWWLPALSLSGNLQHDIDHGDFIPLDVLVSGKGGPDIRAKLNLYYVEYWSLSHFLFHFEDGRYAGKYKQLIRAGGTAENFERIIGPMDRIQNQWYRYLRQQAAASTVPIDDASDADAEVIFIQ